MSGNLEPYEQLETKLAQFKAKEAAIVFGSGYAANVGTITTYLPGDMSTIGTTGIPVTKLGQKLTFVDADAAADVYHTVTTCAFPCLGLGYDYQRSRIAR